MRRRTTAKFMLCGAMLVSTCTLASAHAWRTVLSTGVLKTPALKAAHTHLSAAGQSTIPPDEAAAIARGWLDALKQKDAKKTAEQSLVPFTLESVGKKKVCEGVARDAKTLGLTLDCLLHMDKLLMDELTSSPALKFKVIDRSQATTTLRDLVGRTTEGDRLVESFINGDGVTFEFILVVRANGEFKGVKAFLVSADFESG